MELIFDALVIIALAVLIDCSVGELPNKYHPLRWMGMILDRIDRRIHNRSSRKDILYGFLAYLFVFVLFGAVGLLITGCIRHFVSMVDPAMGEGLWIVATAILLKIQFSVFSFRKHCDPICMDLDLERVDSAAKKVQMIVSRDTKDMDPMHINSSCCESVSENLVDSVYSPIFFFGLLGLPGVIMFRCANLMDAMWGYKDDRYLWLGRFPARFDDVLGFLTSRMSPYFIAAAAYVTHMDYKSPVPAARLEHNKTPSPNSGWSMAATAAALGIAMEKKGVYYMGVGRLPSTMDVQRCLELTEMASVLFIFTVGLVLYAVLGINVQIFFENMLLLL